MGDDPTLWRQLVNWMWAVLMIPLGLLWRKVEGSASKDDVKDAIEVCKESNEKLRESIIELYKNAEADRRRCDERFQKAQETLHAIHVEVLNKLGNMKR